MWLKCTNYTFAKGGGGAFGATAINRGTDEGPRENDGEEDIPENNLVI